MTTQSSEDFWRWFLLRLCHKEQIILPNLGSFSMRYKERFFIQFKPTGAFKKALEARPEQESIKNTSFTGDENPVRSAQIWGPIVEKSQSIENLSLHRQLIWFFSKDQGISVLESATIVRDAIHKLTHDLLCDGQTQPTNFWKLSRMNRYKYGVASGMYSSIDSDMFLRIMSQLNIE